MALFKRMKSPKDRHVTHQTLETSSSSPSLIPVEPFRRHKSEEDIILAVESSTAILDVSPPELPPRNRSDSSGAGGSFSTVSGYRRTQSSGTMSTTGFKNHPPVAGTRPQEDYFVPADTLRNMSVSGSSPQPSPARLLAQDKRHMSMHDKILSHNAPDFRASQLNRSVEKLHVTDTSDYSVPYDVLGEGESRKGVPPPKPPHLKRGSRKPQEAPEKLSEPPDYLPPLPPSVNEEEEEVEQVSPQSSPSISKPRPGDYDDPWDSTKFIKLRQRSETEPPKLIANRIDPYKSPKGSNNELSETEPPLPPKLPDTTSTLTTTVASVPNDTHFLSPSPTPPPVPETSRPRASTDIQPLMPPAFPIDTSCSLEEQLWYHGKISRDQAEDILRNQPDFSFLVRNSESCKMDYSLSIRDRTSPAAHGFIHLKISNGPKGFVLGQFSSPFRSVPECISFYTQQPLTIKNINHRRLGFPVGRIQFTHH